MDKNTGIPDALSAEIIASLLAKRGEMLRVELYDSLDSTNTLLQQKAASGETEGLIVAAETQTHGRGRQRRAYFCPPGCGLYFSILLRPCIALGDVSFLTVAAAAAAAQAIETLSGRECAIKWVNDIWMDNRKVCGILTEAAMTAQQDRLDYAIVGIGVNVYSPPSGFPDELSSIASAVFTLDQTTENLRNRLMAEIIGNFFVYYRNLEKRTFFSAYKQRSFVIGRQITVIRAGEQYPALALDIDEDCRLLVRYPDGSTEKLNSGEISIKPSITV